MKRGKWLILAIVVLVLLIDGFYIISETEQAIITQFGEPVGKAITKAGLHFKMPLMQKANIFDKRILEWDGEPNQIPTIDKKFLSVDIFARWRIVDPLLYYESVKQESSAQGRLDAVINGVTRDIIAGNKLIEIVRDTDRKLEFSADDIKILQEVQQGVPEGGDSVAVEETRDPMQVEGVSTGKRQLIQEAILKDAREEMLRYGIEVVDVRIKRVNYIESVRQDVYQRMIAERNKISGWYRSTGIGEADVILGEMGKRKNEIESTAYRTVQQLYGEADAEATRIYAAAYNQDADFYQFWQTLETYKQTMKEQNTLILSTDSDYYKYLKEIK